MYKCNRTNVSYSAVDKFWRDVRPYVEDVVAAFCLYCTSLCTAEFIMSVRACTPAFSSYIAQF
jgi:hypothetical protein